MTYNGYQNKIGKMYILKFNIIQIKIFISIHIGNLISIMINHKSNLFFRSLDDMPSVLANTMCSFAFSSHHLIAFLKPS